jgi:hypothetical protein
VGSDGVEEVVGSSGVGRDQRGGGVVAGRGRSVHAAVAAGGWGLGRRGARHVPPWPAAELDDGLETRWDGAPPGRAACRQQRVGKHGREPWRSVGLRQRRMTNRHVNNQG